MKAYDGVGRHGGGPGRGREHERPFRAGLLGLDAEPHGLARRLRARAGHDVHVTEAGVVERFACVADRERALVVRQVLRLAVAALDEDAGHAAAREAQDVGRDGGQIQLVIRREEQDTGNVDASRRRTRLWLVHDSAVVRGHAA